MQPLVVGAIVAEAAGRKEPDFDRDTIEILGLIFASFGYNAPRNGMMVIVLLVCAASVAGAIFLILEIDGAVSGLIVVSSDPIQHALAIMRR